MPELITLKCPTCEVRLGFEKWTQSVTCAHCGNVHLLASNGDQPPAGPHCSGWEWLRAGE